jgi:hypothetical protein
LHSLFPQKNSTYMISFSYLSFHHFCSYILLPFTLLYWPFCLAVKPSFYPSVATLHFHPEPQQSLELQFWDGGNRTPRKDRVNPTRAANYSHTTNRTNMQLTLAPGDLPTYKGGKGKKCLFRDQASSYTYFRCIRVLLRWKFSQSSLKRTSLCLS